MAAQSIQHNVEGTELKQLNTEALRLTVQDFLNFARFARKISGTNKVPEIENF